MDSINSISSPSPSGGDLALKDFQLNTDIKSKLQFSYGKVIAEYINSTTRSNNSYYWLRNNRFRKNRNIANGRIDMRQFMDRLDFNGTVNYANINWACIKIASTTISRMVSQWMGRNEKIQVTAVDIPSVQAKKKQAENVEMVFANKDKLALLQQKSGVPMIKQDQFVPEDKDDLDQWVSQFNELPEEIKYEMGVNAIFESNGWTGINKEKQLHDSAEVGLIGTYTYMNENGEIIIEWIKPENMIYSYSEYPDFRDTTWRGHVYTIKISELRAKYGKEFGGILSEEQIFQIACTAKEYQLYDKITWLDNWNISILRPYDEWNVNAIRFQLRSLDKTGHNITKVKETSITFIKQQLPKELKDNQQYIEEKKWNIYEGVFLTDNNILLEWGLKKNMIRPQNPKEMGNAEFSYSFYMYQNYDMRNIAIPEKIEEPLDQMIIARLKIQQLVAKMKPAGAAINVDAMQELDLGLGNSTKPLEVQKIWEQSGNLYYRGRDAEGNPIPMPITELPNAGFAQQLESLIKDYQFHSQVLKDELGKDIDLVNQALQPRVTEGNVQAAIQQGNDATDYMYDAFLYCQEETAKKVACLLNASVSYDGKKYREILKQDEVKGRVFQTKMRMLPTEQEIAQLQNMINNSLLSNPDFVLYCDNFKIMRVAKEDIKLAELLYRQAQKRAINGAKEQAAQNAQQNGQIQQQAAQAKAQGDMQQLQTEMQMKGGLNNAESNNRKQEILLQGLMGMYEKGVQVPQEFKGVEAEVIKNVALPLFMQNASNESAANQMVQNMNQQSQQESQPQQETQLQEQ